MGEISPPPTASANRLAKVIARHGLCSRRTAEQWIVAGRVRVNDKTILTPAFNVTGADVIEVDGAPLAERRGTRVWLYHKPAGLVVTENDPEGRPTIFDQLKKRGLPRVLSVGRLDINTEGLLLLTNDGGLKRVLELPTTGWLRRYRVRAHGRVEQSELDRLKNGTVVDGVRYGPIEARLERVQGANVWLLVALSEGKNREIKNVLSAIGLQVNRLIRISFGPFQLGDIGVGGIETLKSRVLQDQLGKKLAKQAGVDFDAPMPEPIPPDANIRRSTHKTRQEARREGGNLSQGGKPKPPTRGFGHRARPDEHNKDQRDRDPGEKENLRRVHFSGGRAPEMFEPKAKTGRDAPRKGWGDRRDSKGPVRSGGRAPQRGNRRPPSGRSR